MGNKVATITDRDGTKIRPGDIVEFYFGADYRGRGTSSPVKTDDAPTKMVDYVVECDGKLIFVCPETGGAAYGWRFSGVCKVIGSWPKDKAMLPDYITDNHFDGKNYRLTEQ